MPEGVDLQSRVPGELLAWRRTTTGEWVGWVCLPVRRGEEIRYVYQYVVAAALSLREDVPDKRSHDGPRAGPPLSPSCQHGGHVLGARSDHVRGCVIGWVISAVVLVVGLVFMFTPNPVIGIVLFALGVVGSVLVTLAVLRVRKGQRRLTTAPGRTTARPPRG